MLSFGALASRIFGSSNDRKVKAYRPKVAAINALEAEIKGLSDAELRARTVELKAKLEGGAGLDDILVPAFATVREAAKRALGQRHFDVQMIGGMVLHGGNIAEMKTGEGKTLVATLPVYLNALTGRGVHVVTVNDYLAKRDSEWMGAVYRFLGLTVGCIVHELDDEQRRDNYNCDVTYGTNNEFGFDYLRDNMKMSAEDMVQFGHRPLLQSLQRSIASLSGMENKDDPKAVAPTLNDLMSRINRAGNALERLHGSRPEGSTEAWDAFKATIGVELQKLEATNGRPEGAIEIFERVVPKIVEAFRAFGLPATIGLEDTIGHNFAIVDEVDSILVDEARTPLIISGPVEDRAELYNAIDLLIPKLEKADYELDEKQRTVSLSESGNERIEELLRESGLLKGDGLYDIENVTVVHNVNQALKAHKLFQRDRDYIVKSGEVIIIDEFTGRMMQGRRYSEGLHQALESKEKVEIKPENQTLASITFQNYFRLYDKLGGMTGTAATEAQEFMDIYGLDVIEIPTNVKVARLDEDDEVYRTLIEKSRAIVAEIADCRKRGQPVLVGTTSIEKSEQLSELLKNRKFVDELADYMRGIAASIKDGKADDVKKHLNETADYLGSLVKSGTKGDPIPHQVLNARYHEQEAMIIAQAGVPGAVTIATNMAGRGTDIQLGGNAEYRLRDWLKERSEDGVSPSESEIATHREKIKADVAEKKKIALESGGLYVIGTERHESRRIDNQLRGRSGRQGDPGRSKFYLSLEDDLMRIFGGSGMDRMLQTLGLKEGEAIVHRWINKALEKAQQKVEARNFDSRKYVLKYDDVMNDQRKVVFDQRVDIMSHDDVSETVRGMREQIVSELVSETIPENAYSEQWDTVRLKTEIERIFGLDLPIPEWAAAEGVADQEIREKVLSAVREKAEKKQTDVGADNMRQIEKMVLLQTLDHLWREHLVTLEHLRHVIGFRAYGQRDPVNEYKQEAFHLFEAMLSKLRETVTSQLMQVELAPQEEPLAAYQPEPLPPMTAHHIDATTGEDELALADAALGAEQGGATSAVRAPQQSRKAGSALDPRDPSTWGRVARNAPCPCGSGKKYKHCHGKHG
jgi:preprotein translocase subunit SecA